ncbi:MAG: hypothetical protein KGH80_07560 [Xanthomonadaceae bacterium]|nr:hypothetical protein [Xanthomonadaceae bacterium]
MRVGKRQHQGLLAFALLALAANARADYKDDYSHGLEAFKNGEYAKARELMQKALDQNAEPATRIRLYGQVFEPYLPQHYLGLLAFKQGDCSAALAQWGVPANKQIVSQLPEISSEQQRDSAVCEKKVAVSKVDISTTQRTRTSETPPLKTVAAETPSARMATGNTPAKPVLPPPRSVEPTAAKPPPPVEKPPVVVKAAPPESLVQAFDQFLAGHYSEVARINPDTYADPHARFHAYLVRAAAKYTQARITADNALLDSAKTDAAAARALDSRAIPDATFFSPAFREFYQRSR